MYSILKGAYNNYLSWEAVNNEVDHLVDCVQGTDSSSSSIEEPNTQQKSALKSAFLWFSTSAIGVVTFGCSAVSAPVRYALGAVAMISLTPPLVSSLRARIYSSKEEISSQTALKVTAVFSFFCVLHGKATYLISQRMESKSVVPLSLVLSNFTMNGFVYILNLILRNNDKEKKEGIDADEEVPLKGSEKGRKIFNLTPRIEETKRKIRIARDKIRMLDDFVNAHPELRRICMEEIQTHPYFADDHDAVLNPPPPTIEPESLDDSTVEIHYMTDLGIELIDLEYTLSERKELFELSKRVQTSFEKYLYSENQDVQTEFLQLSIYKSK